MLFNNNAQNKCDIIVMHRDIELNRIVDMIIVIKLNRETSADSHPY